MANFNGLLLRTTSIMVLMAAKAQEDSNHKVVGFPVPKGFGEMEECFGGFWRTKFFSSWLLIINPLVFIAVVAIIKDFQVTKTC